jgi:crotonobetainyl-CoA:carnitine CoA-transferase CaiB-like acyl-CoA transferase
MDGKRLVSDGDGRPLEGVRVLEAASFVSAPFGAMMLADLGAEVTKVEPPKGDPYRRFGRPTTAVSPEWYNVNRGKRGVTLDLKTEDGVDRFRVLLARSDVLVANWRRGVGDRLGLSDDSMAAADPRLIRIYVSGYGPSGPYADLPAFDYIIQARGGHAAMEGDPDQPRLTAGFLVDKVTASFVAQSALAALYQRERTGVGAAIDLAMFDALAYFDFPDLYARRTFVDHQPAEPRNPQVMANRPVRAKDGFLQVAAVTSTQIRNAMAAVGHEEWAKEILANPDGGALSRSVIAHLEQGLAAMTMSDALDRFAELDVPAAPCVQPDEHLADPQAAHSQIYEITTEAPLGRVRRVRHPARSASWGRLAAQGPVPTLSPDAEGNHPSGAS